VPGEWSDRQIEEFANEQVECGSDRGWTMMRTGNRWLHGHPERVPCEERSAFVHVKLEA
jgi:hypothetical protein